MPGDKIVCNELQETEEGYDIIPGTLKHHTPHATSIQHNE